MYLTLRDRPVATDPPGARGTDGATGSDRAARRPVARVVVVLGVVSMLTDISSESVAAILPLYLTAVVGLSTVAFGVVDGLYQGVSALVRIAGGWAADRGGHPKWVALAGYGISCAARFGLLVASGFGTIAATLAVDRVGKGLRTAPRDAMIAAATPPEHLGRAFGVHRALDGVGAAVGPVLAFVVLWLIPDGYLVVMVVSVAFAVVGVALLGLLVPDSAGRTARSGGAAPDRPARAPVRWRDVLQRRMVRLLVVAGVLGLLTVGDGFVYLALLERADFAAQWFPLLYVGTNIAFLALAVPAGRLADRVGRARVLVLGHLALAAAYLCAAAPGDGAVVTLVALLLLGVFYAATDGVVAALAGRLVPEELRASGIATVQTVVAVSRLVSSIGFGVLWFALGASTAMLVMCGGVVLAVPAGLLLLRGLDHEQRSPRTGSRRAP